MQSDLPKNHTRASLTREDIMNKFRMLSILATLATVLGLAGFNPATTWAVGPVVHHVSAGGPDICAALGLKPGCDANFSLTANQYADGSVTGQYSDRWRAGVQPGDGIHAVIYCVSVVGNEAWISGVITTGTFNGVDLTGLPVGTRVRDNGAFVNDPADEISYTNFGDPTPCTDHPDYPMFAVPQGQVVVK